jgi:succinate dehydrogenase hydrophobic anchor subunit
MATVNKVCLTACLVSIVLSAVLGLAMIWTNIDPDIAWRTFLTFGVFFLTAAGVSGVYAYFQPRPAVAEKPSKNT